MVGLNSELTNQVQNTIYRIRKFLFRSEPIPKEPRKKIQMQLVQSEKRLKEIINNINVNNTKLNIPETTHLLLNDLYEEATELDRSNLLTYHINRLNQLVVPLLNPSDYSIWLLNHTNYLTEEINQLLKSL